MKNRFVRLALVCALVLGSASFAPPAQALPDDEVGIAYFDECMEVIYERVITCEGAVVTWGNSAGAKYKNNYRIGCRDSGYESYWYEWDGSQWVLLPGLPNPGC